MASNTIQMKKSAVWMLGIVIVGVFGLVLGIVFYLDNTNANYAGFFMML